VTPQMLSRLLIVVWLGAYRRWDYDPVARGGKGTSSCEEYMECQEPSFEKPIQLEALDGWREVVK
jgi:hypothetical protein